ncbi:IS110 family transposase, partial [Gordonibacter sp. KGMB07426]|uniref:IS110 family transposase n=1 Tax=Gordonibacter sp. KGMB07426 TaxID=3404046 RepID=UPI003B28A5B2
MYFIGIDIAKHDHVAAVVDDSGTLCAGPWSFKNDAQGMKELAVHLAKLKAQPDKALVAMEATGHYWMATYTSLIDAGWK